MMSLGTGAVGVLGAIGALTSIGIYVCLIFAIVKMFQNQDTTWGIVSTILFCIPLVGLVRAYQKRDEWEMQTIVNVWLGLWVVGIVIGVIRAVLLGGMIASAIR